MIPLGRVGAGGGCRPCGSFLASDEASYNYRARAPCERAAFCDGVALRIKVAVVVENLELQRV